MNASDLLLLLLSAVPVVIVAAMLWRTVEKFGRDEILPDEQLLSAIKQHGRSAHDTTPDWTRSY